MISYIILILSLIMEDALSLVFYGNSLFLPLFLVISLYIIYPLLNGNNKKYIIICLIAGLIYDIVLGKFICLNGVIFLILSLVIIKIYENFEISFLNNIFITILIICLYYFIKYLLIILCLNKAFNFILLLKNIYSSLIINTIYSTIFYFVLKSKK